MNRRIACALIPDFPLVALLRDQPELTGKPVALAENPTNRSTVLNANSLAAKEGIEAGMTIVQAMNVCPELTVLVKDEKRESFRFGQLLKSLRNFSPHVEQAKPQAAYLDVSGFKRKYPQEKNLAEQLVFFVKMQGYPVRVGIADNKFTSLTAAWISPVDSYFIVPAGKERKFLESQPIQLLPIDQEQYERLYRLGIRTMGQFAVLPDQEVAERFGSEGVRLLKLARGEDDSPLKPTELDEKEKQIRELESPLGTQIGILFYVNSILEEKLPELAGKGLACEKILVTLSTADNNNIPIQISVAEGINSPKTFIDILRLELEKIILPAPVSEISLSVQATSALSSEQLSLYNKKGVNLLRSILTKLRRVVGNGNVLSPQLVLVHRPEGRFHLTPVVLGGKEKKKDSARSISESFVGFTRNSISGFRLYHPPKPATVRTENGSIKFVIGGSWFGDVTKQAGPWELSGEWWSHGYDRSYFEIELSDGARFLLFLDNSTEQWFVQGIFD
jgi:protein ImuB